MRNRILAFAGLLALAGCGGVLSVRDDAARAPMQMTASATLDPSVRCARFAAESSTAFDPVAQRIQLPWRDDLPATLAPRTHAWDGIKLTDWQAYMAAVLTEVRASGLTLSGKRLTMAPDAPWWIAPWMDFTSNGREPVHGLTRERSPDPGDLAPNSPGGLQVWAVGFYNGEGSYALNQVFADPCDPAVPSVGWTFPEGSASFKLLFTNADASAVDYLSGAPEIEAYIDTIGGGRAIQTVRLLQVDVAIRDKDAPTGWVFGTYVWKKPRQGDGLLDNLVPVGLMWGNDKDADADPRDNFAALSETRLNPALQGLVWRAPGQIWPTRPWPGFQGRLNGPADNLRSSCLSCHALAQWPRSALGIVPNANAYSLTNLNKAEVRLALRENYMRNVVGGKLTVSAEANPSADRGPAVSLDYSLQIEAGFSRLCAACANGVLTGKTPAVCKVKRPGAGVITAANCPLPQPKTTFNIEPEAIGDESPPRQ